MVENQLSEDIECNDDHINEEIDDNFSLSLSSYLKTFECKIEDKMKFLDEVAKIIEKDIECLKGQIQSYSLHDHDHSFQKLSMEEHRERVLLPFSFVIEEEYTVIEDQLVEVTGCYENHQTNHVFFDPIANYMEKIYCSGSQLYVHLEEQLHLMLPCLLQYLVYFCFKHSQEIQVSNQIYDWLHWKFHVP